MRRAIAEHMVRSKRSAPHAWLVIETDVTGLVRARQALKDSFREREGVDLSYLAFVAKTVTQALRDFPPINSTWDGDQLYERGDVNLGFAVDVPDGLIVPVVKQADRMSVAALAHAIADVAARARAGRLKLDEVQGGTFTIDNTGTFGTTLSAPIINQPPGRHPHHRGHHQAARGPGEPRSPGDRRHRRALHAEPLLLL